MLHERRGVMETNGKGSRIILHVSGIPATGKSWFCSYLARDHGFVHYDLEWFPQGWPVPELYPVWCNAPLDFVRQASGLHPKIAIDWGFPPDHLPLVRAFRDLGVRLLWFNGDVEQARRLYAERGGRDPNGFEFQVQRIRQSGLPGTLDPTVVETLTPGGSVRPMEELYAEVFAAHASMAPLDSR